MNKKPKNIEQLFSESFNDFRIQPSSGLWKRISSKLAWKTFLSFNPTTFNAYYLTGILAVSIAGALWITNPVAENNHETNEISINNTIETPVITTIQENDAEPKEVTTEKNTTKSSSSGKVLTKADSSSEVSSTAEASAKAVTKEEVLTKEDLSSVALAKEDNSQPASSSVVSSTAVASAKAVTKEDNQKPASSSVALAKEDNQQLSPSALFKLYPENPDIPNDPINFINLSKNAVRYEWDFGDSESSDEFEPVHFYNRADNYNIKLKVWSEDGNMDSLVISYDFPNSAYKIEFPNAFTPNPNGPTNGYYTPGIPNNNVFHPVYKGVVEYHLSIFNRRGELIFESNDINRGWDGYINDRLAAQDVYVWKVRGRYSNGESFIKFGNVMLIKK